VPDHRSRVGLIGCTCSLRLVASQIIVGVRLIRPEDGTGDRGNRRLRDGPVKLLQSSLRRHCLQRSCPLAASICRRRAADQGCTPFQSNCRINVRPAAVFQTNTEGVAHAQVSCDVDLPASGFWPGMPDTMWQHVTYRSKQRTRMCLIHVQVMAAAGNSAAAESGKTKVLFVCLGELG